MMEKPEKQCRTCGETKPLDAEHFYSRKDRANYFSPDCKDCHKAKQNANYANNPEHREKRKMRQRTPEARDRKNALRRERRTNDSEWREKENARKRERYRNDAEFREKHLAKQRTPEYRERHKLWNRNRWKNNRNYRETQLARQKYKYHNDQNHRENLLYNQRQKRANDPRVRERDRERWATDPEYKTRKLTRQKVKYHSDPDYREKYLARRRTPEYRERNRLWHRNRWKNNPEFRKRQSAKQKYKYHNDPEYRRRAEERGLFKLYGITKAERELMKLGQGGVCAICGQGKKLEVDHNHQTGRVRGLLCHLCNRAVGLFSEDIRILTNAIEYLKSPGIAPRDVQPLSTERPLARFEIPYWEAQSRDARFRKIKNKNLKQKCNIDINQYEALLEKGDGVCWICFLPETRRRSKKARHPEALYVDHHHSSGLIRGLLCRNCNTGVGCFEDDPERIAKAIEYLEKWNDAGPLAA